MESVHIEVVSWVRTPLPEVELVGAAKYPLHRFNTIRNELCFVNKCLYCTAARLVKPPGKVGCRGLDTPCTAYISYLKAHIFFFVCAPVGMPDVCMWYVVQGMRYEVQGYEVCGARYEIWDTWHRDGVRGTPFDT